MTKKITLTLIAAFLFASVSIRIEEILPEASAQSTTTVATSTIPAEKPARIIIPAAQVDRQIIPVGVTKTNNLDVPPNFVQVGWYEYGPMPGQHGSAVLDGHVDNGGSTPGPFKHLRDVKVGDDIQVVTEQGTTIRFKVTATDIYQTDQFPSDKIFNDNSGTLIKLITCHGTFVPSRDTYDQRLVVTAELVS